MRVLTAPLIAGQSILLKTAMMTAQMASWARRPMRSAIRPDAMMVTMPTMPKNTGTGAILSGISVALAFGLIWYMWWLVVVSAVAMLAVAIGHTFNYRRDFYIPAEEVTETEGKRTALLAEQV